MKLLHKFALFLLGPAKLAEMRTENINSITAADLDRAQLNRVVSEYFHDRLRKSTPMTVEAYASAAAREQIGRTYVNNLSSLDLYSLTRKAYRDPIQHAVHALLGGSQSTWEELTERTGEIVAESNNRMTQRKRIQDMLDELFGKGTMEEEKAALVGLLHYRALRVVDLAKAPVA